MSGLLLRSALLLTVLLHLAPTAPAAVVTAPAAVVTAPAAVVTAPAAVVTAPAAVVTAPAAVVTAPAADTPTGTPVGTFVLPLPGAAVLTPFKAPAHRYGPGHRGVDLGAAPGAAVGAAGPGVVVFAGRVAGRSVVSVQHGPALRTTYEPVLGTVAVGAAVTAGEIIGTLEAGHAGCPAPACLHWGARLGAAGPGAVDYLDPLTLLRPRRVRLLPWVDP